jgi:hypothetical protein
MHTAFITLALATVGAIDGARPLTIPKSDAVDRIVVRPANRDQGELVINDAKRIDRLLNFLSARNEGWKKPWYTFPTSQRTILLEKDKKLVLVLWVGPNWLGGREGGLGAGDNRLRSLTEKDLDQLLEILGITKR